MSNYLRMVSAVHVDVVPWAFGEYPDMYYSVSPAFSTERRSIIGLQTENCSLQNSFSGLENIFSGTHLGQMQAAKIIFQAAFFYVSAFFYARTFLKKRVCHNIKKGTDFTD